MVCYYSLFKMRIGVEADGAPNLLQQGEGGYECQYPEREQVHPPRGGDVEGIRFEPAGQQEGRQRHADSRCHGV